MAQVKMIHGEVNLRCVPFSIHTPAPVCTFAEAKRIVPEW
jgi:hypothetical protein